MGFDCRYGAKILPCSLRYRVKELEVHRPICFTTSNGIPRSKYSNVEPIRKLWPVRNGILAFSEANLIFQRKIFLVNGSLPL